MDISDWERNTLRRILFNLIIGIVISLIAFLIYQLGYISY